jgi:hypothetical protein
MIILNNNNIAEVKHNLDNISKIIKDHTEIFNNRKCNCKEWLDAGYTTSGVYTIYPTPDEPIDVYCDQVTEGGGWTLVGKSKVNSSVNYDQFYTGKNQNLLVNTDVINMAASESFIGVNIFDVFDFTKARLIFTAKSQETGAQKTATFYKSITRNNVNAWFVSGAKEPDDTVISTDVNLSVNATSRPFDHDYHNDGTQTGTAMLWGADLEKLGYTKTSYHPFHGPGSGWCSATSNADNNNWPDDYADGHWGNGLTLLFR